MNKTKQRLWFSAKWGHKCFLDTCLCFHQESAFFRFLLNISHFKVKFQCNQTTKYLNRTLMIEFLLSFLWLVFVCLFLQFFKKRNTSDLHFRSDVFISQSGASIYHVVRFWCPLPHLGQTWSFGQPLKLREFAQLFFLI